jgi:hypothetical protein
VVTTTTVAVTTTTTQPPAQAEATALASLLSQSSTDRASIVAAVDNVSGCQNLDSAESALNASGSSRQSLLSQIQSQLLTALPNGNEMAEYLITAWQNSLASDQSYAAWAEDEIENGCTTDDFSDSNYQNAQTSDANSTASKTAFANLWNPIATQYGLSTETATSF